MADASLGVLIVFALVIGVLLLAFIARSKKSAGLDKAFFVKQWQHVESVLKEGRSGRRLAIIDADKLVDIALKKRGFPGKAMGDRLRAAESIFSHYNALWSAHKLRNKLVHEPNIEFSKKEANVSLAEFHRALKELGAL